MLNVAFQRTSHHAAEYRNFTQQASSFVPELDLIVIAQDGSFSAYVGICYDSANRCGIFEPLCTHPDHRRKGLARTLMVKGLHRLRNLGATHASVGTGDMVPANQLYDQIGFQEVVGGHVWRKTF